MSKNGFAMRTFYCPECGTMVFAADGGETIVRLCPFCRVKQKFVKGEDNEKKDRQLP